jgi:hypothetical protein
MTPINPLQAPINYAVDVESPFEAALGGLKVGLAGAESQARTKESLAREAEYLSKIQGAKDNASRYQAAGVVAGDPRSTLRQVVNATVGLDSAQAKVITDGFNSLSEEEQRTQLNFLSGVYSAYASGAPEIGKGQLQAQELAYNNAGMEREAQAINKGLKLIDKNPVKAMEIMGQIIAAIPGGNDLLANIQKNQETIRSRNSRSPSIEESIEYANLTPEEQKNFDSLQERKKAGTTINVNTTENAAAKELGALTKDLFANINSAAKLYNAIPQYRLAAESAVTGFLANKRIDALRLASFFGYNGKDELVATRILEQGFGEMALMARDSLKGQGSVSDYEGKLLQRAASGDISYTKEETLALLDVFARGAKQSHATNYKLLKETAEESNTAKIYLKSTMKLIYPNQKLVDSKTTGKSPTPATPAPTPIEVDF